MEMQMALPRFRELPSETRAAQRARLLATVRAPRRRRGAIVAITVGVAVLAAAPTLAFQRELVDFWSAEPAPERIQLDWDKMRQIHGELRAKGFGAPSITPVGTGREVLRVNLDGERRALWVIPTEEGGFCYRLHFHGSCARFPENPGLKIGAGGLATRERGGFAWIVGAVLASDVHEIELVYQDGERRKLPFVWVSPPIDAGFYAYEVPPEHEQSGHLTAAVVGLDEDGNMVAGLCLRLPPDEPVATPEAEALCKRP
jgi:hypothetical protein